MKCAFVVGQKVVCVEKYWRSPTGELPDMLPVKGVIYTVRELKACGIMTIGIALRLRELPWWHCRSGFRPLQDRPKEADTDISIFHPLLNVKQKEDV